MNELKKKNDILKLLAIITMLVDHIGVVFFPQMIIFRVIGRLSLPIFTYHLALGHKYTSNFWKYFLRLLVFGLISQVPYALAFETRSLNIIIAFVFAILFIYLMEKKKYVLAGLIVLFIFFYPIDSSFMSVLMPYIWVKFFDNKIKLIFWQTILISFCAIITMVFNSSGWIYLLFIPIVFLILYFPIDKFHIRLNKYFFYIFYPLHLFILWLIKTYI